MNLTPEEYQQLAARTECDQMASNFKRNREDWQSGSTMVATRLTHAALGLAGEVGELAYAVEKWLHYGQDLDKANVEEELGDAMWYIALACNALGLSLEQVMAKNIAKLHKRYPDKYSDQAAAERADKKLADYAYATRKMTKQEVAKARLTSVGCCNKWVDKQACNCLQEAVDDNVATQPKYTPPICPKCGKHLTDSLACPQCYPVERLLKLPVLPTCTTCEGPIHPEDKWHRTNSGAYYHVHCLEDVRFVDG